MSEQIGISRRLGSTIRMAVVALTVACAALSAGASGPHHRAPAQHGLWGPHGRLRVLANAAKQSISRGDFRTAENQCHKALAISPGSPVFKDFLAQIAHRRQKAVDQADFATEYAKARGLVANGDLEGAAQICRTYLAVHPGESSFQELSADIQARIRGDANRHDLLAAIHHINRLINLGDDAGADQACRDALHRWPDNEDLRALRRRIRRQD